MDQGVYKITKQESLTKKQIEAYRSYVNNLLDKDPLYLINIVSLGSEIHELLNIMKHQDIRFVSEIREGMLYIKKVKSLIDPNKFLDPELEEEFDPNVIKKLQTKTNKKFNKVINNYFG